MPNDPRTIIEPADPVAHPHYPQRPPHAARAVYTIVTEPLQEADEDAADEAA